MMKGIVRGVLAACLMLWGSFAWAQDQTPVVTKVEGAPRSYLFVGNSFFYYNNSMHSLFLEIARAADKENAKSYRAVSVTISGSGLNWHDMESYFGKGMASYSFVGDNEIVFNDNAKPFDVVIMNDCSQCPVNAELSGLFREYVKKHGDTVRRHGAIPVLFMTWAYQDRPEMTVDLAKQYTIEGNRNEMLVIPAGLAFAKALAAKPDLVLYQKDKRHPTLAGSYLGAATIYAAMSGRSPAGIAAYGGLDPETARFLQGVAWETAEEYYGRK